jgi:hypothetical protein
MRARYVAIGLLVAGAEIVLTTAAWAERPKAAPTNAQLIASAMSAAPAKVAGGATIVAMEANGTMRTLRKGTNAFTCIPDNPTTPGPDPMCMDKNAMEWVHALVAHQPPTPGKVGFMYMLAGGTDASNTDPYAAKPDPTNHWIKTGPHTNSARGRVAPCPRSPPTGAGPRCSRV